MKFKKFLILLVIPFLLTGCNFNFELYNPDSWQNSNPDSESSGTINVIMPSNFQGTFNYAPQSQTLLTKEEVYAKGVQSTVYITGIVGDGMVLGSGVVASEDSSYAYIFTNAHVVENMTSIEVTYSNYKKSKASLVGYNTLEDVAVIKVEKNTNYKIATLQTSDKLSVAMEVLAIGTPAEIKYNFTATSGIISRIDSAFSMQGNNAYESLYIQTDTSLNNGNSGGPLFDMYGNLIGLNSIKLLYTPTLDPVDDINFSIPMERAVFMANSFFNNKPYTRGKLGISILDISEITLTSKEYYNITLDYGLYISESSNSLFLPGDIITKINGIEFKTKIQFQKELYNQYKNTPIEFTVYRNGQYKTFNATLQ